MDSSHCGLYHERFFPWGSRLTQFKLQNPFSHAVKKFKGERKESFCSSPGTVQSTFSLVSWPLPKPTLGGTCPGPALSNPLQEQGTSHSPCWFLGVLAAHSSQLSFSSGTILLKGHPKLCPLPWRQSAPTDWSTWGFKGQAPSLRSPEASLGFHYWPTSPSAPILLLSPSIPWRVRPFPKNPLTPICQSLWIFFLRIQPMTGGDNDFLLNQKTEIQKG